MENRFKLIYVGDPMCSWCYGFSPELSKLVSTWGDQADFEMLMGGLRPYAREPMDERTSRFLHRHWQEVGKITGQPFDYRLLERNDFYYATEVPSRAVLAVRQLAPGRELAFFQSVQRAFYAKNKDTNQEQTYLELAGELAIDADRFLKLFRSAALKEQVKSEFNRARQMGVTGFPTVLFVKGTTAVPVCAGFAKAEQINALIEQQLNTGV